MGQSTDGQICFGVLFPDGVEFPWDKEADGDHEEWWRKVQGYEEPFSPWDEKGEYAKGFTRDDPRIDKYFEHRRAFDKAHPFPAELVNVCHIDSPIWILAVPSTCKTARRGYPEAFDPASLAVTEQDVAKLKTFLAEHIKFDPEEFSHDKDFDATLTPKWYLSSYWG